MKIDVRNKRHVQTAIGLRVFNSDTGEEIRRVVWADVAKGEYGQHRTDETGKLVLNTDRTETIVDVKKGNIELRCR